MLDSSVVSELKRAAQQGRAKSVYGANVLPDTVFSTSSELGEIAARASQAGVGSQIAVEHTWSVVEPTAPLPTYPTTIAHYGFNETTGAEGADASQNDNDIAVSGTTWASGKFGNCLVFDGTADSASVTAVSVEPLRNYLYVSCWVNPSSLTGTRPILKLADRLLLYFDVGVLKAQLTDGVTVYTVSSGQTAVTGSFQFITCQFIDGAVYLAIGDLVYKTTIAATTFAEEYPAAGKLLEVGYDGTNFYAGSIDELLIEADVRVQDDFPIYSDSAGINDVIYAPFAENTGTSVFSSWLLGPHFDLTGGTWVAGRTRFGVSFDGTDDYATCTPTAETFTDQTVSLEVGIKFAHNDVAVPILTQDGGINLSYDGAGGIVAAFGGVTNPATVVGLLTPNTTAFYSIVIVYDGVMKELWVNGQKYGETAATGTALLTANPIYIAKDGSSYGEIVVDRVRLYRGRLRPWSRSIMFYAPGYSGFTSREEWITP